MYDGTAASKHFKNVAVVKHASGKCDVCTEVKFFLSLLERSDDAKSMLLIHDYATGDVTKAIEFNYANNYK